MGASLYALCSMLRPVCKPTNVAVAAALIVVAAAGLLLEYQNRRLNHERLRSDVLAHVSVIHARLEGHINGNLELVRGLVATIASEPQIRPSRFVTLARELVDRRPQIVSITAAPGLVVKMAYPTGDSGRILGMDYARIEPHRQMAELARSRREVVLQGPLHLQQNDGAAFIGHFPVFVNDGSRQGRFWGLVSVAMRADALFRDSGLTDPALPVDVAIAGRDGKGRAGEHFFGDHRLFADDPVLADVTFPSGAWTMAAVPAGGWNQTPPNTWFLRFLILAGGVLVFIPAVAAGRLVDDRLRAAGQLRNREIELERLSRRLTLALDSSRIGVWELNTDTGELFWDDRVNEIYGYPADGGTRAYKDWEKTIHPDDAERVLRVMREKQTGGAPFESRFRLQLPDGQIRHVRESARAYTDQDGTLRLVGITWDATSDVALNQKLKRARVLTEARNVALRVAKERIEFNALHDALTGLPNRRYLDQVLAAHVEKYHAEGERAGLLHLDLDRFKQINDTLGHAAGDALLIHVAGVLKTNLRRDDFIARIGADEFIVLCKLSEAEIRRWEEILSGLAQRTIEAMQQPVIFDGHESRFSVSIGIACDVVRYSDPGRLLVNADLALNRAKSRGRNRYQFFNDDLHAEIVTTKRTADDILSGLERNEFIAHYQPQFDAVTHDIVGVEALVRWNHPTKGLLRPGDFIKIAEELNVLATIDRMILEQVLADIESWEKKGLSIPKVSVNVSARRLNDEELIRSLRELRIKRGTVAFELVESIFFDDNDDQLIWNVDQIKALGIDIEIDDFGTGYTSIISLLKLRPRRLKIDRQLITPILSSQTQRHLVGSIIDIGKTLGIEVVAEGVETMEHAELLKLLGCKALQGHAFAQAMSRDGFLEFVRLRKMKAAS